MLKVSKIEKSYGASKVLRGIDFRMEEGERIAIMGPSGSGKSTLLNCIGGIDRPDNGEILFEGQTCNPCLAELECIAIEKLLFLYVF